MRQSGGMSAPLLSPSCKVTDVHFVNTGDPRGSAVDESVYEAPGDLVQPLRDLSEDWVNASRVSLRPYLAV